MTDPTSTAAIAIKAAKTTADSAHKVLPTVIETAELAMEVPSRIVLNQKLVVVASILAGGALGAGVLYGVNKIRNRGKKLVVIEDDTDE